MAVTTIYARRDFATSRPDSPPRSAPGACQKLPGAQLPGAALGAARGGEEPSSQRRGLAALLAAASPRGSRGFLAKQSDTKRVKNRAKTTEEPILPWLPSTGPVAGPGWYWALLGSGWVGTVLLVGVVLWLLQQHGGNNPIPSQDVEVLSSGCSWESCWTNSNQRATPEFKCSLSCFRLQLRQRLCEEQHQHPTGPSACRLCPAGWQPFAAKCYWISTKTESWEKAAKDCLDQRSQLVKLESAEEKVFIGNMTKNISAAWLGLSITRARGKEWTWWDGSPLQGTLFKTPDHGEGDACATIQRGELNPHSCTTPLHWICQKEATEV